ncbi:hypothetical protein LAZ67_22001775 [Cordylochernes scorpioides]|uniref:DUF5641 domain-containing protein n=1 Tax=Cordylochernes scorpioides TaxID=51811 RepID=A0ABY6LTF5_9ARAC|nr:hypothetical protein LAZ67_22001775 [Cordylochernes scorpioides]
MESSTVLVAQSTENFAAEMDHRPLEELERTMIHRLNRLVPGFPSQPDHSICQPWPQARLMIRYNLDFKLETQVAFYFQTPSRVLIIPNCMLKLPLKRLRFNQISPFSSNNKKFRNDIVTERLSRQDKEMEFNQDPIGVKTDNPTKERGEDGSQLRENEQAGERQEMTGRETTAPLADFVTQLSALLTRTKISDGAEATIALFDGTYSATQFFQAFDRKMEDASMGEQEKLLRLPNYLVRQPLELFRKLRLADRSYFQEVILETLTEGLPFNDQRLVRVVPPENLGEWFRLVQRIHGPSVPTTRPREDQPPTMSGPYHNTPRRPGPTACSSKLGWILSGNVSSSETGNNYISLCATSQGDDNLRKFFELESVPAALPLTKEEKSCGDIYDKNFCISTDGRYSVGLPFKSVPNLGDSRQNAMKRFLALERKLHKSSNLLQQYKDFMMEYLSLNHMELIPKKERDKPSDKCYYIPHHCVLRDQSSTTKLRVVFDASCKTSNNYSLNDFLHTGPKLQHDIFNILVKFRTNPIAFTGDIEKMYRQIKVNSSDLDFQRIFWRNSPLESLLEYRLLTVTYGMSCAPYLAIRTLMQLATDKELLFPEASKIIKTDFYVDDLLSGATTIEEAKVLIDDIRKILLSGGFCIRKWMSNVPEVLSEWSLGRITKVSPGADGNVRVVELQTEKQHHLIRPILKIALLPF